MAEVLRIRVRADTVWQDSAGTIPAGVGDPVGRVDDPDRGISVTQDVTGSKPTLLQDGNGHLYLDGDGLDDYLSNATFQPTPGGAQPFTVVAVARAKGTATINPLWGHGAGNGDYRQRTSSDYQLQFGTALRRGTPDTNLRIHHTEVNGAASAIYIDNALQGTVGNAGSNAWAAGLYVLSISNLAQFGNQELYELIIYDGLLDATARTALYDELWDYYSNPAGGGDVTGSQDAVASATFVAFGGSVLSAPTLADQDSIAQAAFTALDATALSAPTTASQDTPAQATFAVFAASGGTLATRADQDTPAASAFTAFGATVVNAPTQAAQDAVAGSTFTAFGASAQVEPDTTASQSAPASSAFTAFAASAGLGVLVEAVQSAPASTLFAAYAASAQSVDPNRIPASLELSLESTHTLTLSVESTHTLTLSII